MDVFIPICNNQLKIMLTKIILTLDNKHLSSRYHFPMTVQPILQILKLVKRISLNHPLMVWVFSEC